MKKVVLTVFLSVLLFSVMLGILSMTPVKAQTTPTVSVMFPNTTNSSVNEYDVGDTFRVDIVVNSPDIGIWSWQVGIRFNSNILNCTDLGDGDFFDGYYVLPLLEGTINNTLGYVRYSGKAVASPETTGVTGTGVLMWFEFHVIGYGNCILNLTTFEAPDYDYQCGTGLCERINPTVIWISPIILYDGYFDNTGLKPPPVGGTAVPINKPNLITPNVALALTTILSIVLTVVYVKERKRKTEIIS